MTSVQRTNHHGDTLHVVSASQWRITSHIPTRQTDVLQWDRVPLSWQPLWQAVCLSLFDQNRASLCNNIVSAAARFHEFFGDEQRPPDALTPSDYGRWHEWLQHQPAYGRGRKVLDKLLSEHSQRRCFQSVLTAWKEAKVLQVPGVTDTAIMALKAGRAGRFRHLSAKAILQRERTTLTATELDRLYAALREERDKARAVLHGPTPEFYGYRKRAWPYRIQPALCIEVYQWVLSIAAHDVFRGCLSRAEGFRWHHNRNAFAAALHALQDLGFLRYRPGLGTHTPAEVLVMRPPPRDIASLMAYTFTGALQYARSVDLVVIAAMWLAVDCGVRPGELHALRVSDIVEDPSGHGHHAVILHQKNKDAAAVPIDETTLDLLRDVITWTDKARAALKTD